MNSYKRAKNPAASKQFKLSLIQTAVRNALGWRVALGAASALSSAVLYPSLAQAQEQPQEREQPQQRGGLEDVVVTGRRAALENATERKRDSEVIVDSVVADEAGMLPDNSITEVLQRVSGVAVVRFASLGDPDHFSAEGSGIQVRGLSGVAGRLNGREVFSASGGRGLSWGDITPELMQAVDVYKASTADLIEGGTGGQIDLRTKMPFDFAGEFIANLSANVSYGDLSEEAKPGASALLTKTWEVGEGRFGALLDIAYNEYSSNADFFRMEPFQRTRIAGQDRFIPAGYDFGNDAYSRARQGAYLGLQWQPTDSFTLSQTTFYTKYDETRTGNGIFSVSQTLAVDPATSVFDDNGFLVRSDNVFQRDSATFAPSGAAVSAGGNSGIANTQSTTRDAALDFNWDATEHLGVKGGLQWVHSTSNRKSYDAFPSVQFPTAFSIDLSGNLPQVFLPGGGNFLSDGNVSNFQAVMDNRQENEGDLYAANLDLNFRISDEGFFRDIGFGARYADRSETDWNSGFNWQAFCQGWNGCDAVSLANARPGDTEMVDWGDFFRGDLNLPGAVLMPSMQMARRFDPVGDHGIYGGTPTDVYTFRPEDRIDGTTRNTAAYLLTRFDGGERTLLGMTYKGNIGVRIVNVENESEGFTTSPSNTTFVRNGTTYTTESRAYSVQGDIKTTRGLPALNLTLMPIETMQIRLAYNVTMDLPSFFASRASGTSAVVTQNIDGNDATPPDFVRFTVESGNPLLKPVYSHNSDLTFEWYPSRAANAHLAFFHKSIDNWLTYSQLLYPLQVTYVAPVAQTVTETAQANNVFNATEPAKVKGIEIGGRMFFDRLPSFWSGLGLEANYTYVDSKNPGDQYFDIDGIARNDVPVQGLSKNNYNLTAMYEKGPLSMRLAWSWRSKYLQSTNSNGTNGNYNFFSAAGAQAVNVDIALPVYGDDYGQLDFGTTWRANQSLALSLEFNNLTNEITRTLQGGYPGGSNIRSWYVSDRRANFSVRYNFH
jgi:iron complex outermembrane recepter protein